MDAVLKDALRAKHAAFQTHLEAHWQEWLERYVRVVERVQKATREEWNGLQSVIWEDDGVTTIGPGNAVTVVGAYDDPEIVQALWDIREKAYPEDRLQRARAVDQDFHALLNQLVPRYSKRQPKARLLRALAMLRPGELGCLMSRQSIKEVRRLLGLSPSKLDLPGQNALIMHALSTFAGDPTSLEAQVRTSIFGWYLFESLSQDVTDNANDEDEDAITSALDVPRLSILPFEQQRKGIQSQPVAPKNFVVRVVRETEHGVREEELAQIEELSELSTSTIRQRLAVLKFLGLITRNEARELLPTPLGTQLIEDEDPADVIMPALLERIFGFAQILWDLRQHPEGLTREELSQRLRERIPRWTSENPFRYLMAWLDSFSMWETAPDKRIVLTERGEYWASGIPRKVGEEWRLEPVELAPEPDELDVVVDATPRFTAPSYTDLLSTFIETASSLVYPETLLAEVHAAFHCSPTKRFVILSGLSGTGKTQLALSYARAYCTSLALDPNTHSLVVPVRPDWTDPTGLLGYFNPLSEVARYEETKALRFLIRAHRNRHEPFFLCLDEMNLARPEYYFAPFLSAMETGGKLSIHAADDNLDTVPPHIQWPENLFIFGTVNMDETTFPFSDKVLDRAFTFELWDVDIDRWKAAYMAAPPNADLSACFSALEALYGHLHPVRRHFGYRTCNEFTDFVAALGGPTQAALDAAILTKVLPKLRGDDAGGLDTALTGLLTYCQAQKFPRCVAKLEQLQSALRTTGIARFFS